MEFLHSPATIILSLALFTFSLFLLAKKFKKTTKIPSPPQPDGAWPILGHLPLISGSDLLHRTFGTLADKYGPIFLLKLGSTPTLVISNWELAKECFTTHDNVFVDRPHNLAIKIMSYNYAMFGLGPYGPYYREIRKLATIKLLSNRRLELLRYIRETENKTFVKRIYNTCLKNEKESGSNRIVLDMKRSFEKLNLNIMVKMVVGSKFTIEETDEEELERFSIAIREFFRLLGVFTVGDAIPWLRWFDFGGYEKLMKKTMKDLDFTLQKWLDEHKKERNLGEKEQDFMHVMLSLLKDDASIVDHSSFDGDTIIKSTCLALLSGGIDTSTVTLTWALSLLMNHPQALKKAQEELNLHVGKERRVEESDMKNLIYLQAIIKEALRMYPAGPLLGPRESIKDCVVGGYHIPKGIRLMVNGWKIQRDPRIWSDPNEFIPERFLTTHKDVDFRGQHFEFVPFGSGRRSCPGISMAHQVVQMALATVLQSFKLETVSDEPVDMSESFGLTNLKATPLELLVTPRLSYDMYA